ncbi:ABC transporter permease [Portibacter lacus]|uniref:ABC transporter permease n=1 Tax=Portibacter lacus TaxID=1099794 RepID=A0AA37SQ28_9BACT|nr:ABC transporter permease [Portibacter lacus]GLR17830.1 ABC transporter permease [Portibacter lacus]
MLKNYIILAWRVLGRKKFFTFISLFGISFTLGILMVIVSFLQTELGTDKPWTNRDRMVSFGTIEMKAMVADTTFLIDSMLVDGAMKYDTTKSIGESSNSTTISSIGGRFLENYFTDLKYAENYTFYIPGVSYNAYVNNSKIVLDAFYTDAHYWEIFDFEFLEGQGYDKGMYERAEPIAVITDQLAEKYFGEMSNIVGREIKMDGKNHKIIGVVKKPRSSMIDGDVWAPTTLLPDYLGPVDRYTGGYRAYFLANSKSDVTNLQDEIENKENEIPMDVIEDYNKLLLKDKTGTMFQAFSRNLVPFNEPKKAGRILSWILIGFISLFVLLPTLNLINLNVSRIMERSSEIGVRKAFGASKGNILGQFIFENVVLTIIGGTIGLGLAVVLIYFINSANLLEFLRLTINYKFFIYSFIVVILFGVLSGFLPAYRMSKIHIVNALKSNKL